jgi:hypothetical protein
VELLTNTIASAGTGRSSVTNESIKSYRYYMDGIAKYKNKLFEKLNYEVMVVPARSILKMAGLRHPNSIS